MQLSSAPSKIVEAFAINAAPSGGYGGKRTIPVPSQTGVTPGAASYNDGFPPLTMSPLPGGVVMSGLDMNGILNEATAIDWWMSGGGTFKFDSVFAAAVGGYPIGARILNAAGTGFWTCIVDNNSNNPDTYGAGSGWIPDRAVASVYASTQLTLSSGTNKILWNTVEFDAFGMWNSGSNRFQAPWAGKYKLSGAVFIPGSAANPQNLATLIYKNGTLVKQCFQFPNTTDQSLSYPFDGIVACAVGDYLETFMISSQTTLYGQASGSNAPYVYGQLEYVGT